MSGWMNFRRRRCRCGVFAWNLFLFHRVWFVFVLLLRTSWSRCCRRRIWLVFLSVSLESLVVALVVFLLIDTAWISGNTWGRFLYWLQLFQCDKPHQTEEVSFIGTPSLRHSKPLQFLWHQWMPGTADWAFSLCQKPLQNAPGTCQTTDHSPYSQYYRCLCRSRWLATPTISNPCNRVTCVLMFGVVVAKHAEFDF